MKSRTKGILLAVGWFLVGSAIALFSSMACFMVGLGGQQTPPAAWGVALLFGMFGLPFPLAFGGIPVGISMARETRPALTAAICISVTGFLFVVTHAIIWIWRPAF